MIVQLKMRNEITDEERERGKKILEGLFAAIGKHKDHYEKQKSNPSSGYYLTLIGRGLYSASTLAAHLGIDDPRVNNEAFEEYRQLTKEHVRSNVGHHERRNQRLCDVV